MARKLLLGFAATLLGLAVAFVAVGAIEAISVLLYPELSEQAAKDPKSIRLADVPTGALLIVLAAWCVGAAAGSYTAAWFTGRVARWRSLVPAYAFGLLFLLACATQLNVLPHPTWFAAAGTGGPAVLIMAAAKLSLRRFYRRPTAKTGERATETDEATERLAPRDEA